MPKSKAKINPKKIPAHVAVIMDGNGRWAKDRGKKRSAGHRAGAEALDRLMDASLELGIQYVTVYAFSTENWSRPPTEIRSLFSLLDEFIGNRLDTIHSKGIRIIHSGEKKGLPKSSRQNIEDAIDVTAKNKKLTINFCLNYGSQQEILLASQKIIAERMTKAVARGLKPGDKDWQKKMNRSISIKEFEKQLYQNIPQPDLLIRTAGEKRVSNFLLWQIAYSEFWFTDRLWPDFNKDDLLDAIYAFQNRNRKFGGL